MRQQDLKLKYDFVYYDTNSTELLTEPEALDFKVSFPNMNSTNIVKLGPPTYDLKFEFNETRGNILPEVCKKYGCDFKEVTYLEIDVHGAKRLVEVNPLVCTDPRFHCETYKIVSLNYNCIGWALGIRDWVNPRFADNSLVQKSTIKEFLTEVMTEYPEDHPKVVLPILRNLEMKDEFCSYTSIVPLEGVYETAFYFKNDSLEHGARYLKALGDRKINSWTSKLGADFLISHSLEDLNDSSSNASYGISECMGVMKSSYYQQHDGHDEL